MRPISRDSFPITQPYAMGIKLPLLMWLNQSHTVGTLHPSRLTGLQGIRTLSIADHVLHNRLKKLATMRTRPVPASAITSVIERQNPCCWRCFMRCFSLPLRVYDISPRRTLNQGHTRRHKRRGTFRRQAKRIPLSVNVLRQTVIVS